MRTVGIGAEKSAGNNFDELKMEIKNLKTANTKLVNKNKELEKQLAELQGASQAVDPEVQNPQ